MTCEHVPAAEFSLTRVPKSRGGYTTAVAVTAKAEPKTDPPDGPSDNAAQGSDRRLPHGLLGDVRGTVPELVRDRARGGRPPVPIRDARSSACLEVSARASVRRFAGERGWAHGGGPTRDRPHFSYARSVFDRGDTTPTPRGRVGTAALPLRTGEATFAVGPAGFAAASSSLGKDVEYGTERKESRWVKARPPPG